MTARGRPLPRVRSDRAVSPGLGPCETRAYGCVGTRLPPPRSGMAVSMLRSRTSAIAYPLLVVAQSGSPGCASCRHRRRLRSRAGCSRSPSWRRPAGDPGTLPRGSVPPRPHPFSPPSAPAVRCARSSGRARLPSQVRPTITRTRVSPATGRRSATLRCEECGAHGADSTPGWLLLYVRDAEGVDAPSRSSTARCARSGSSAPEKAVGAVVERIDVAATALGSRRAPEGDRRTFEPPRRGGVSQRGVSSDPRAPCRASRSRAPA